MKKLGLRVLAGSLAALMVASTFTPAKSASAADDLLIAPAPISVKTLYITEDMVDEDGEIVISGENWERVVVSKEVAADKIYFDQVTVGELVVESGSKTNIELWGVDAEKLTVQEPEIKKLSLNELLPLLADKETQQAAIDTYLKNKTENERALNTAPSIVTKEDAKVDTLVVRANATLNLETGEVGAVALEASDKLERAKVTLKNYNGDVTYKGGENFNSMTLKNVDSRIKTLTVDESSANNYFNVTAKNSVVLKAEVAGNAQVSLNAPMGTIEITEAASAAQVCVLNVADEMKVAANGAKVQVAMSGSVAAATITGNNVNIGGEGSLSEVEITGKGAYVTTNGTKVEGENTYVKPVYVEPEKQEVVIKDVNIIAGDGTEVTKNANGSATISFPGATNPDAPWKAACIEVPGNVDVNRISSVTVNVTTSQQFGLKLLGPNGEKYVDEYPGYNIAPNTTADYEYSVNPAKEKVAKIEFVCLKANQTPLTVNSVTFKLLDEAPAEEEKPLVTENKTIDFNDISIDWAAEGAKYTITEDGAIEINFNGQYQSVVCRFPESVDPIDYPEVRFNMVSPDGGVSYKMWQLGEKGDQYNNPKINSWNNQVETVSDVKLDLGKATAAFEKVEIMSATATQYSAKINSITFIGSGNVGKDDNNEGGNEGGNQGGNEGGNQGGNTPGTGEDQKVTVTIDEPNSTALTLDDTLTLSATPSVSGSAITWTSSNLEIAAVDENGVVTPKSAGTVTITASCGEAKDTVDLTVEKAFYLFVDKAFEETVGEDNSAPILKDCYMDGSNFSNKIPAVLKNDAEVKGKFESMNGITEIVKAFEFEITFTDATAKDPSTASYEPQVEVVVQGNGTDGKYANSTYKNKWVGIGEATAAAPKTGKTTFYFSNQTFDNASADSVTWADVALGQIALSAKNAAAESTVVGYYSIKVIMN